VQNSTLERVKASLVPLPVKEVLQAGDTFLVRIRCEACRRILLADPGHIFCECGADYRKRPLLDSGLARGIRCLSGTQRKGRIPMKTIRQLIAMAENMCSYCSADISGYFEVEHIKPLSYGGTNSLSNLCLSCKRCNLVANSLVFHSFNQKRDYILAVRFKKLVLS
jgi:hypothetical protein